MRYRLLVLSLFAVALGANAAESTSSGEILNKENSNKISLDENKTGEINSELKRNIWLELGAGSASTLEIKTTLANRGWALAGTSYDDFVLFGDSNITAGGTRINEGVSELALMRTFSNHGRWFYTDASIGLGYMKATLANNCVQKSSGWLGATNVCDEERKQGISIPMELDIAWGRYVGIGLKLRASIGPESKGGVAITFPLGTFAKR